MLLQTLGDLSILAKETGSRSLLRHEAKQNEGEIELFRRLQDKCDEVEKLKHEMEQMTVRHNQEKQRLHTAASQQIQQTAVGASELIESKMASIEGLSMQLEGVLTNGKRIIGELEDRLCTGKHFPNRLEPAGLLTPAFSAPRYHRCPWLCVIAPRCSNRPQLPEGAHGLGSHAYEKLERVIRASQAMLPGDQQVLQSIRDSTSAVHGILAQSDSKQTEVCLSLCSR